MSLGEETETSTEELLETFGSDPDPQRRHRLFYKGGECFVKEDELVKNYPRQPSLPYKCNAGPLLHQAEECDSAILLFDAWTEQDGIEGDLHNIRRFKIRYHLKDDTISLTEPFVENSGFVQGRLLRRQKVPSNHRIGNPYVHWSDFNIGNDINLFETTYHITSCDSFTRNYLEEHGIKVNDEEEMPEDPWLARRNRAPRNIPKMPDQREFMNRPPVLMFRCCWLDGSNDFHGSRMKRIFKLIVYCADHTVALIEETQEFQGELFLKRIALPVQTSHGAPRRHYRWWDIRPGVWIDVFSRAMFVFDCANDDTRRFIRQQYGETDFSNYSTQILRDGPPASEIVNVPSYLVFRCIMVDAPSTFYGSHFLLFYDFNKRIVDIVEEGRKPWTRGRSFLRDVDAATFGENTFSTGRIVQFFKWRFNLVEGDPATENYLKWKAMPSK